MADVSEDEELASLFGEIWKRMNAECEGLTSNCEEGGVSHDVTPICA